MDIISPRTREEIDAARTLVPMDSIMSEVRNDRNQRQYCSLGPNKFVGGEWQRCSAAVKVVSGDYRKALDDTLTPVKYGDGVWHTEIGGYRLRAKSVVGFDKLESTIFSGTPIEAVRPTALDAEDKLAAFGEYGDIRFVPNEYGVEVKHTLTKALYDRAGTAFIGTVWEIDDPAVMDLIEPGTGCKFYRDGNLFVEYVPQEVFLDPDGKVLDSVAHNYITIAAGLGANLELAAGVTYYLTANVTLGAFDVTSVSTADERAVVKTSGAVQWQINGAGTFVVSYIDHTSVNDDTLGETIVGSTGAPAAADQTVGYVLRTGAVATALTMDRWTVHYCTETNSAVIGWSGAAVAATMSLTNGTMRNCVQSAGSLGCLIGRAGGSNGAVTITNLSVDATCVTVATGFGVLYLNSASGVQTLSEIDLAWTGAVGQAGIYTWNTGNFTHTISNCRILGNCNAACIRVNQYTGATVANVVIQNCTLTNTSAGAAGAISCFEGAGTLNVSVINNILLNNDGAGAVALNKDAGSAVTHTYNGYFNNTANAFEALTASEFIADPALGNLPATVTRVTDNIPFPDGYAVTNLADYERQGSDTFDNLGIDESIYSMTGIRYPGDNLVTPGIYYELIWPTPSNQHLKSTTGISTGIGVGI